MNHQTSVENSTDTFAVALKAGYDRSGSVEKISHLHGESSMGMGPILSYVGGVLVLIAYFWLVVIAFQRGNTLWGVLNLLIFPCAPICGVIYGLMHWRIAHTPTSLAIAGWVLSIVGAAMSPTPIWVVPGQTVVVPAN
jgi:hypothetical protein